MIGITKELKIRMAMTKSHWILLPVLFCLFAYQGMGQRGTDTATMIKEFNAVMAFSVKPYLHYNSTLSLRSIPQMSAADSVPSLNNDFYKSGEDMYNGNAREELYLQDSLLVQISHARKAIQISKLDPATRKKVDLLPLKSLNARKLMQQHYLIEMVPDQGDTACMVIRSKTAANMGVASNADMSVWYFRSSLLPIRIEVSVKSQRPVDEQTIARLRTTSGSNGIDIAPFIVEKDGVRWLNLSQVASVRFGSIEEGKVVAAHMPQWQTKLGYDPGSGVWKGIGTCDGYEIMKTF
jgi:hypothetical protein